MQRTASAHSVPLRYPGSGVDRSSPKNAGIGDKHGLDAGASCPADRPRLAYCHVCGKAGAASQPFRLASLPDRSADRFFARYIHIILDMLPAPSPAFPMQTKKPRPAVKPDGALSYHGRRTLTPWSLLARHPPPGRGRRRSASLRRNRRSW